MYRIKSKVEKMVLWENLVHFGGNNVKAKKYILPLMYIFIYMLGERWAPPVSLITQLGNQGTARTTRLS